MYFDLPSSLRDQVAIYDPAMRPLIEAQKRAAVSNRKKATAPLGLPNDLFPVELITASEQIELAQQINSRPAGERAIVHELTKGWIAIAHHEQVWLAAWCYKNNAKPYLYGVKVAHKAAASTTSKVPTVRLSRKEEHMLTRAGDMVLVKYGKTEFFTKQLLITENDVVDLYNYWPWANIIQPYNKRGGQKYRTLVSFTNFVGTTVPRWADEQDTFSRIIATKRIAKTVFGDYSLRPDEDTMERLTEEALLSRLDRSHIYKTPFFAKEVRRVVDFTNDKIFDPDNDSKKLALSEYKLLKNKSRNLSDFLDLYPDATLDHCQQVYELAGYYDPFWNATQPVKTWVTNNVPIKSFIGILSKSIEDAKAEWKADPILRERALYGNPWGGPTSRLTLLNDTLGMIDTIWRHQKGQGADKIEIEHPSRWRLSTFHDHVAAIVFKCGTKNEILKQDLFPEPMRVDVDGERWSFFQPQDVHQLASWGQAVRNCVGSASSYREGINRKSHFIILVMIDRAPRFTVQAKLSDGRLHIDQIADISNRRLDDNDRHRYGQAFYQALQLREAQLKAAA